MSESESTSSVRFSVGDVVQHNLFDYHGVVIGVDSRFEGTDEWYDAVARSRPPKDQPWYHVLVDQGGHTTYVAERHLEPDAEGGPIDHPALGELFGTFHDGRYALKQVVQ